METSLYETTIELDLHISPLAKEETKLQVV